VFYIDTELKDITWQEFKDKFMAFGGSDFYGAWALSYNEPALREYKSERHFCQVAERIQPTLIQLKTNYEHEHQWQLQAVALEKTVSFFDNM